MVALAQKRNKNYAVLKNSQDLEVPRETAFRGQLVYAFGGLLLTLETKNLKFRQSKPEELNTVVRLMGRTFENTPEYWNWKYLSNPTISSSLLMIIEEDKTIVGCGCWLPRHLKVSSQLEVDSLLASHITIDPEHQRRGLGSKLVESIRTTKAFEDGGYSVSLALILEAPLYKNFYKHITRHVPVSESTIVYAKFLTCAMLRKRFDFLNRKIQSKPEILAQLAKLRLSICLLLKGSVPFTIRFSEKGIELEEGLVETDASFTVKGDFMFIKEISEGTKDAKGMIAGYFKGKLGLRGNPLRLPKLYKVYKLIKKAYQA
jgi:GNAT superfamily N-acetyltransferase